MARVVKKYKEIEVYCHWYKCECGYDGLRIEEKFCSACGSEIVNWGEARGFEEQNNDNDCW